MPKKPTRSSVAGSPQNAAPLYDELRALLREIDTVPAPPRVRRPGRPTKRRADTAPVILHLYTSQLAWLDHYADAIAGMRQDNVHLSRVEIVRGLLLGLAMYALNRDMDFPTDMPVTSERDLQHAIATALDRSRRK